MAAIIYIIVYMHIIPKTQFMKLIPQSVTIALPVQDGEGKNQSHLYLGFKHRCSLSF